MEQFIYSCCMYVCIQSGMTQMAWVCYCVLAAAEVVVEHTKMLGQFSTQPNVSLSSFSKTSFDIMSTTTGSSTPRFQAFQTMAGPITREQTVEERYGIPENFLEIEVKNPQTHGKLALSLSSFCRVCYLSTTMN